jgi:excisionase family DNA binding protein
MVSDEMLSPEHDEHAWISLQEASERLEVAVATVRRWGDAGRVPMKRTLGGHRRFLASAIDELARTLPASAERAPTQSGPQSWGVNPHELTRQSWHIRMAAQAHPERLRGLGQRLLGLLIQFVNRDPEDARFLEEASAVGASYGVEAHEADISLHDTIEAFLFFRSSFSQISLPGIAQPTDLVEANRLHSRIQRFMDATLLGTIKGYESARP